MAARIEYDKAYCTDLKQYKDPRCRHEDTVQYDGKFEGDYQTEMQLVCAVCGMVSEWGKNNEGSFMCRFPKVK